MTKPTDQLFKETDARLHPIDRRISKRWIKMRLVVVFPELRNNPNGVEAAYQALSLEPRAGIPSRTTESYFELTHH